MGEELLRVACAVGWKLTDLTSGQKLWARVRAVNSVERIREAVFMLKGKP